MLSLLEERERGEETADEVRYGKSANIDSM